MYDRDALGRTAPPLLQCMGCPTPQIRPSQIPIMVVNGRMSPQAFARWRRFRFGRSLVRAALSGVAHVMAQSAEVGLVRVRSPGAASRHFSPSLRAPAFGRTQSVFELLVRPLCPMGRASSSVRNRSPALQCRCAPLIERRAPYATVGAPSVEGDALARFQAAVRGAGAVFACASLHEGEFAAAVEVSGQARGLPGGARAPTVSRLPLFRCAGSSVGP